MIVLERQLVRTFGGGIDEMDETASGFRFIGQVFPFVGNLDLVVAEIVELMDADFRKRIGGRHVGHVKRCTGICENVFRAF